MSMESPTLKIRVALREDVSYLGRDCTAVAKQIVGESGTLLDAKWGREPQKWHETGRGWGRQHLDQYDRGFLDACRELNESAVIARLVRIIDGLAS